MIYPNKSEHFLKFFRKYNHGVLKKQFHTVFVDGSVPKISLAPDETAPILVILNHTSWWDMLLAIALEERMTGWNAFAAMDSRQLRRYRFFTKLGVIGVDRTTLSGAKEFVDYAATLLNDRRNSLWITPQGRFVSTDRPVAFQPGIGHIASKLGTFYTVCIAFDYEFWDDKKPEGFISIGDLKRYENNGTLDKKEFVLEQSCEMDRLQKRLNKLKCARDPSLFQPFLISKSGVHPVYDAVRAIVSRLKGNRFHAAHGDVLTPGWNEDSSKPSAEIRL